MTRRHPWTARCGACGTEAATTIDAKWECAAAPGGWAAAEDGAWRCPRCFGAPLDIARAIATSMPPRRAEPPPGPPVAAPPPSPPADPADTRPTTPEYRCSTCGRPHDGVLCGGCLKLTEHCDCVSLFPGPIQWREIPAPSRSSPPADPDPRPARCFIVNGEECHLTRARDAIGQRLGVVALRELLDRGYAWSTVECRDGKGDRLDPRMPLDEVTEWPVYVGQPIGWGG